MDKEVRFGQILMQVKKDAVMQGNMISEGDVSEAFAELELDKARLDMVKDYLRQQKITVVEGDAVIDIPDNEAYTPSDVNFLEMYLEDLKLLPDYHDGEKKAFTIRAMAGDKDAQSELIKVYLRDVVEIARIYNGQGVPMEDLIGEGNVALSAAVTMLQSQEKTDDCNGMIVRYVMDAMEELIKENSDNSDISDKVLKKVNDIFEKAEKLSNDYGRPVTVSEICEEYNVSRKSVIDAIRMSGFKMEHIETPEELRQNG